MVSAFTGRISTIVVVLLVLVGAAVAYEAYLQKKVFERRAWECAQRERLVGVKNRMLAYMADHDGNPPKDTEELVSSAIVSAEELDYYDEEMKTRVKLQYRPVPPGRFHKDLILIIERHEPLLVEFHYVTMDGTVWTDFDADLKERSAKDNRLRRELGIPIIEDE